MIEKEKPGQGVEVQLLSWSESPTQSSPPNIGIGLSHIRCLLVVPGPQSGHGGLQADQFDHPPVTRKDLYESIYKTNPITSWIPYHGATP